MPFVAAEGRLIDTAEEADEDDYHRDLMKLMVIAEEFAVEAAKLFHEQGLWDINAMGNLSGDDNDFRTALYGAVNAPLAKSSVTSVTAANSTTNICRAQPGHILRSVFIDTPGIDGSDETRLLLGSCSRLNGVILLLSMTQRVTPDQVDLLKQPFEEKVPRLIIITQSLFFNEEKRH